MKATFSRQALMSGIGLIQNVGSSATTLPILANILFDADAKGVNLIATDLECFARVYLETEVEEAGRVAVPAKTLGDIVRLLPDDTVAVVTSGTRMTLTCGRNVYHLTTMNAEDFPDWPSIESANKLTLKQSDFGKLLRNTLFAMPARDPRKVLMGALFEIGDMTLTCVATDGRKLGRSLIEPIAQEGSKDLRAIVPGRLLNEIERAIGEEGEIEIIFSDQRAAFTLSNLNLTYLTSLIEGKFPQHDAVIPKSFKKTLELPKGVVTDAIGRAAILAERKHHSIVMSFKKNSLNVTSQSFEDGSYQGDIDLDYDGEPFKVAFNYHYLNDVFRVAPDAILRMKVKESSAPIVFECESDLNSIYLVMPVRIHDLKGAEEGAEESAEEGAEEE